MCSSCSSVTSTTTMETILPLHITKWFIQRMLTTSHLPILDAGWKNLLFNSIYTLHSNSLPPSIPEMLSASPGCIVQSFLRDYSHPVELESSYYCSSCSKSTDAWKRLLTCQSPLSLCIQVVRFQNDGKKLGNSIDYKEKVFFRNTITLQTKEPQQLMSHIN
ncbi:unnamed protein product [Porites evermanni]|uniref:Uncharacterized protein n=1 Tax=Porites evermanni TaxID=104178 RepID=A0ABN8M6V2_9CNID|nr:unnamed protein product [Porites evermanni]